MKNIFIAMTLVTSLSAQAGGARFGSECGLTDGYHEGSWVEVGQNINLTKASPSKIRGLDTLVKQQLIIAAKLQSSQLHQFDGQEEAKISNTQEAVEYLRQSSDSENLSVSDFRVRSKHFTQVLYYPGDNAGGVIFEAGTTHAVAFIADSDVVCK